MNRVMRRSVEYAFAHPQASLPYVRAHAQEMSEEVMYKHIDLYVNQFRRTSGTRARAIELMFAARGAEHHSCHRARRCFLPDGPPGDTRNEG
jgi:1,4-dihydroxy-6-naphthoate synthase